MFSKQLFAKRLKELREKAGLNQKECAEKLNVSRGSISFYENEERLPDIETVYNISTLFGVSVDYLIGLTDVKTSNIDIKATCDYTGLTERSISTLNYVQCKLKEYNAYVRNNNSENELTAWYERYGYLLQFLNDAIGLNDMSEVSRYVRKYIEAVSNNLTTYDTLFRSEEEDVAMFRYQSVCTELLKKITQLNIERLYYGEQITIDELSEE